MGLGLLFPGQGTQHAQMLPWLEAEPQAAEALRQLVRVLGRNWRARLADASWSTRNDVAQPLLVGIELAAWACLAPGLPRPVAVAGYSVGELAAFAAAGVFDAATAVELATARAAAMDRSVAGQSTVLWAVRDVPLNVILAWCERHGLALAIRLGPDRAIVGAPVHRLEAAVQDTAVAAGRVDAIDVRVASHTPWMQSAAQAFACRLAEVPLRPARVPVVCDLTGAAARQPAELAHALAAQIASTVLWDSCLESVAERGASCVLEVGPGTTLASMCRARYPHIPARSADEFRSAKAASDWAVRALAGARG